ncbi:hypothetical protein MAE02_62760 [Microvirga aerophila]|uniref:Uncharacterized protein n=1 Tax=Microvirga aerophila TaxID=670291 RepID=A0A512C2Z1_9HYPH|nr:hypothetical protein MAE02_62760 [Microvirga aerophila]
MPAAPYHRARDVFNASAPNPDAAEIHNCNRIAEGTFMNEFKAAPSANTGTQTASATETPRGIDIAP